MMRPFSDEGPFLMCRAPADSGVWGSASVRGLSMPSFVSIMLCVCVVSGDMVWRGGRSMRKWHRGVTQA